MTMNGAVLPVLAGYIVAAEEQGVDPEALAGTIQNDILKEFMVRNTYIYPPSPSMRIIGDIIAYCSKNMPRFNTISISGYHMQEAGANAALELAYTLADGRNISVPRSRQDSISTISHPDCRFLGHRHEFLHGNRQDACRATFVGGDRWRVLTEQSEKLDVENTLPDVRLVADRAGSLQQHCANNYRGDGRRIWRYAKPSHECSRRSDCFTLRFAARIARNTQLVLQEETGISQVVDPWGGSYMMESLTNEIAEKARALIAEVEDAGGMAQAIETGLPKLESKKPQLRSKRVSTVAKTSSLA